MSGPRNRPIELNEVQMFRRFWEWLKWRWENRLSVRVERLEAEAQKAGSATEMLKLLIRHVGSDTQSLDDFDYHQLERFVDPGGGLDKLAERRHPLISYQHLLKRHYRAKTFVFTRPVKPAVKKGKKR